MQAGGLGQVAMAAEAPEGPAAKVASEVRREIQKAIEANFEHLERVAPERLISLAVHLPDSLVAPCKPGGDTRWIAPNGELVMYAGGVAERYVDDAAERYRRDAAQWHCRGTALPPLAFFTVPPATFLPEPTLWIPKVLVRHGREGLCVTLSARRRRSVPLEETVNDWLDETTRLFAPGVSAGGIGRIVASHTRPDKDHWQARVTATRDAIVAGRLEKAVLARRLRAQLSKPIERTRLVEQLSRLYSGCHVFSIPYGPGHIVAATPEPLAMKRGSELVSHALAGTVKRSGSAHEEAQAAAAFLASPKERHEHALVVETIEKRMAQICTSVEHAAVPSIMPLRFVQHLRTKINGRLREGIGLLDAVTRLHPTPAVLGTPSGAAREWLAEMGECRDSLYTGVAGWIDRNGDGDAVVILRSAYIEENSAVLWAGAGIMAESDPVTELAETELKFQTMLEALGASL